MHSRLDGGRAVACGHANLILYRIRSCAVGVGGACRRARVSAAVDLRCAYRYRNTRTRKGQAARKAVFSSYNTRGFVYAFCSAVFNTAYIVFGIVIAAVEKSAWLGVLVGYHVFLLLPRLEVLITAKLKARGEGADEQQQQLRAYTNCGLILILLALAIIPVIRMTLRDENSYNYFISSVVYVITIALYTTVKVVVALYNFRKARKQNDMALIAVKNISLANAFISVFTLQALMLKELDSSTGLLQKMNPAIGAVVVASIFALGLFMLIDGKKRLKKLEAVAEGEDRATVDGQVAD